MTDETRPSIEFDLFDPSLAADPLPVHAELRRTCPIGFTSENGGHWVATSYEDIYEITHQPEVFGSRFVGVPRSTGFDDAPVPPLNLDPPDHALVKRILTGPFLPAVVESRYRPITSDLVASLIDGLLGRTGCDAAQDFARLVPTKVVCRILGVSDDLIDQFTEWVHRQLERAHGRSSCVSMPRCPSVVTYAGT